MARYLSANDIINRAALECGLLPSNSPLDDADEAFVQLVGLLNSAGQELCELHPWQKLVNRYEIVTQPGDTGEYDLPDDFNYMLDQTGWDRTNDLPVGGPLSAQDYTYLVGRDLASNTLYASFRIVDGVVNLFPAPPPEDLRLTFEYISRNWLQEQGAPEPNRDTIGAGSDTCVLDPLLIIKMLKLKFLQAKGFDTSQAALEFDTLLGSRTGKSTGASILSASNSGRTFPYLSPCRNVGDTGFGG